MKTHSAGKWIRFFQGINYCSNSVGDSPCNKKRHRVRGHNVKKAFQRNYDNPALREIDKSPNESWRVDKYQFKNDSRKNKGPLRDEYAPLHPAIKIKIAHGSVSACDENKYCCVIEFSPY